MANLRVSPMTKLPHLKMEPTVSYLAWFCDTDPRIPNQLRSDDTVFDIKEVKLWSSTSFNKDSRQCTKMWVSIKSRQGFRQQWQHDDWRLSFIRFEEWHYPNSPSGKRQWSGLWQMMLMAMELEDEWWWQQKGLLWQGQQGLESRHSDHHQFGI